MLLGLKDSIASLVKTKYATAKAAGALTFSDTELSLIDIQGALLQLRYCPALSKKPTQQHERRNTSTNTKKIDPFENPAEELLIAKVPSPHPSHALVLNKFPIIAHHFILATTEYKEQTHALEADDLGVTYQCLRAWQEGSYSSGHSNGLFAFFNSGEHSGASQPHRHLQLLPIVDMQHGVDKESQWTLLLDQISKTSVVSSSQPGTVIESPLPLPFVYFVARVPQGASAESLHAIYTKLYNKAATKVEEYRGHNPQDWELHSTETGSLPISYNLGFSTESMMICPRRREGDSVYRPDGSEIDSVSLNGTILGGTLMVKNEELWHILKRDPKRVEEVLRHIGIPRTLEHETQGSENL